MKWSYGVTTILGREQLLSATVASLRGAGFDEPRIYWDHGVGAFGNWIMALWDLYLREPKANRYAIFQDDIVACRNLRKYLDGCRYPETGYWNLFTHPGQRIGREGWDLSNQNGLGALALVFDNRATRTLLSQRKIVDHPLGKLGRQAIDAAVCRALRPRGWTEYIHNPSLVQHTGVESVIGHKGDRMAVNFIGEDFDATHLLSQEKTLNSRVGIVAPLREGWEETSMAWEIATYCEIDKWLVLGPTNRDFHPDVDTIVCKGQDGSKSSRFLRHIDAVFFIGNITYPKLLAEAIEARRRVVCILSPSEPLPVDSWWKNHVHLLLCTTEGGVQQAAKLGIPHRYFEWPISIEGINWEDIPSKRLEEIQANNWPLKANELNQLIQIGEQPVAIPI